MCAFNFLTQHEFNANYGSFVNYNNQGFKPPIEFQLHKSALVRSEKRGGCNIFGKHLEFYLYFIILGNLAVLILDRISILTFILIDFSIFNSKSYRQLKICDLVKIVNLI